MKPSTAHTLNSITGRFYDQCAESFSSTRRNSWAGWDKALSVAHVDRAPSRVLDIACGNLRFEEYIARRWPEAKINALCVDGSLPLLNAPWLQEHSGLNVTAIQEDIIGNLIDRQPVLAGTASDTYDLIVCFGFMHHVPSSALRAALLERMGKLLAPNGMLIVSFWQFLNSPKLAEQAVRLTQPTLENHGIDSADLEPNDCFLSWQNSSTARRYCHSFTAQEVENLAIGALPAARFDATFFECDGRNGKLNRYLVAKRGE